jgi:hypothetical protein
MSRQSKISRFDFEAAFYCRLGEFMECGRSRHTISTCVQASFKKNRASTFHILVLHHRKSANKEWSAALDIYSANKE